MENFVAYWRGRDMRKVAVLAGATLVTFLSILMLTRMVTAPGMDLLFARLDPAAAGEVVAALEARGTEHEVRGDAIYVPAPERDALRLQLAGEGLPRSDGSGYELLDELSGFGTTSQMFDAAYWRAREGELTRTILAGDGVKAARVHVATADASPFSRTRQASASVTMQMRSGAVGATLARSVQSLVAGAVPNLEPDGVTVIDSSTGHVVSGDARSAERDARDNRTAEMRAAIENLLAARVGDGRYVVELAVETREDREVITERRLDPDSRVVLSTDTEERTSSETDGGAGVTVASNLPDGDAAGGSDSAANNAETRERVNYDFSATERQIEKAPGTVERITVAVMVDGLRDTAADGTGSWSPRPAEELATLRELVQSAVGYREERGDVVTVHSMEFDLPPPAEVAPALVLPWLTGADATRLGMAGLLAVVALGVLAFLVRPTIKGLLIPQSLPAPVSLPTSTAEPAIDPNPFELPGPSEREAPAIDDDVRADLDGLPDLSQLDALPDISGMGVGAMSGSGQPGDDGSEDPVERLRQLISERREETIEVLRGWMEETPEDVN